MTGDSMFLQNVRPEDVKPRDVPVADPDLLLAAGRIVEAVHQEGEAALRRYAVELDGLQAGARLFIPRSQLLAAWQSLPPATADLLQRLARRIREFAEAQRACLVELDSRSGGCRSGHRIQPVSRVGAYAPGGRYPLPSSVLMTCIPAQVAGVDEIWVASPRPDPVVQAAAHLVGASGLIAAGGAQAIAALAYGSGAVPPADLVVGPGNRWVTAAKQLVASRVRIDQVAGPSELVILADETAPPELVAADLLAQAEHDPDAFVALITTDARLISAARRELETQLADLATAAVARQALTGGLAVHASSPGEAIALCDRLAPEHLQVMTRDARETGESCRHYGALFLGSQTPQVLGDYGAGPNHTLPTAGFARSAGGLSVLDFLCVRTFVEIQGPSRELLEDARQIAQVEGLEAHARAVGRRLAE